MVFAVVTGGGTSGHAIPAISLCEALMANGHAASEIKYVGTIRGVEMSLMTDSLVECLFLPISGLQRSFTLRGIMRNIALPWRLFRSRIIARRYIKQWSPQVVVSVGGYASEPMSRAAIAMGIPLVCVSYDQIPGLATRRQAQHATACAVAFEGSALPRALVTGAPVRQELRLLDVGAERTDARRLLGIPAENTLVVFVGGSLGSASVNSLALSFAHYVEQEKLTRISILHLCGTRFLAEENIPTFENSQYICVGYESRMKEVYAAADVFVARAGASTIAEIATVGVASVLIPWPGAANNHQEMNARWLSDSGAAILTNDVSCANGSAVQLVVDLIADPSLRAQIARNARNMGAIHRSDALVNVIENAARPVLS